MSEVKVERLTAEREAEIRCMANQEPYRREVPARHARELIAEIVTLRYELRRADLEQDRLDTALTASIDTIEWLRNELAAAEQRGREAERASVKALLERLELDAHKKKAREAESALYDARLQMERNHG